MHSDRRSLRGLLALPNDALRAERPHFRLLWLVVLCQKIHYRFGSLGLLEDVTQCSVQVQFFRKSIGWFATEKSFSVLSDETREVAKST